MNDKYKDMYDLLYLSKYLFFLYILIFVFELEFLIL